MLSDEKLSHDALIALEPIPDPGVDKTLRDALPVAQRNDERKLVLGALRRMPSAEALSIVFSQLDESGLKNEAAAAAIAIGERIRSNNPDAVAKAMRQVSRSGVSADLQNRAKKLLQQAENQ